MHHAGTSDSERWNRNLHYHPLLLDAVPAGCERALDVGCGEGMLTRQLAGLADEVVGIDVDRASIELANTRPVAGVTYVEGDVLDHRFETASFDVVTSVAALHHMGTEVGLRRMAELVRPGGVLAVVGIPRPRFPLDLPFQLASAVGTRWHLLRHTYWEHSAPLVWPPPETHGETVRIAQRLLPGVRGRRHLLGRFSLVWTKPA